MSKRNMSYTIPLGGVLMATFVALSGCERPANPRSDSGTATQERPTTPMPAAPEPSPNMSRRDGSVPAGMSSHFRNSDGARATAMMQNGMLTASDVRAHYGVTLLRTAASDFVDGEKGTRLAQASQPATNSRRDSSSGSTSSGSSGSTSSGSSSSTSSGSSSSGADRQRNSQSGPGDDGRRGAGSGMPNQTPGTTRPQRGSSTGSSSSSSGGNGDIRGDNEPSNAKASASNSRPNGLILVAADDSPAKPGQTVRGMKLSSRDKSFVEKAAAAGLYEVEAARIAVDRASDPALKSFAQMLVKQHTEANTELKQLVSANTNVELPIEVTTAKRLTLESMRRSSGKDFDQAFTKKVGIEDHEEDIKLFEKASREANDPAIRAWAGKKLPVLQEHLAAARKLPAATGSNATMGSSETGVSASASSAVPGGAQPAPR